MSESVRGFTDRVIRYRPRSIDGIDVIYWGEGVRVMSAVLGVEIVKHGASRRGYCMIMLAYLCFLSADAAIKCTTMSAYLI